MPNSNTSTLYMWDDRILHISHYPDIGIHRLGGAAFLVCLDGEMAMSEVENDAWRTCRTALVPPGCAHRTRFGGNNTAIIHIEPESIDYANLSACMPNGEWSIMYDHIDEDKLIDQVTYISQQRPNLNDTHSMMQKVIYGDGYDYEGEDKIDARIARIVQKIKDNPAASYPMADLAEEIELSPTRFIHLFKEQTGVPIRRFRQWLRMKMVIRCVAHGKSLTEAALEAGFTDSAHFSRAFKNMFGITPSSVFNRAKITHFFMDE